MKRTLFLSVLFGMLLTTAHAENESHQQVESTLYAYYRWCNNNIRDTAVLSKADTLFRLTGVFPFPSSDHRLVWVDLDISRAGR